MVEHWIEKNKQIIRSILITGIVAICFFYGVYRLYGMDNLGRMRSAILVLFIGIAVFAISYMIILQILTYRKEIRLEKLFIISTGVLALGYMLFFAPVKVPDEQLHYASAYRISNFMLFQWNQANTDEVLMRACDADFYSIHAPYGKMTGESYASLVENFQLFANDTSRVSYDTTHSGSVPWGYLASALGIAIGRLFHLGAIPVFYLGRMFNVAVYIILIYMAMKRAPMMKGALAAMSAFPMTLHLVASYSYDGVCIGLSALFVAEVIRMIYEENITWKQVVYSAVLAGMIAPNKLVYTPVLFMALMIPNEKLKKLFRYPMLLKLGIIAVGLLMLLVIQLPTMLGYTGAETATAYVAWADEEGYTLSWALAHLQETLRVYLHTFLVKTDYYLTTMLGSSLGWFQFDLPLFLYLPFGIMFILACFRKQGEGKTISYGSKLWITILLISSITLIVTSMFLSWTPISFDVIQGVQGRYFLPLLPAVYILIRNNLIETNQRLDKHILVVSSAFNLFVLLYCSIGFFSEI